jgi:DNA segregation ATPase FtsK/SpoIIIE-like protein
MKVSKTKKKQTAFCSETPSAWKLHQREIFAVAVAAVFIFSALSLGSYNICDNSPFFFSSKNLDSGITNLTGSIGAQVASALLFFFGAEAYLLLTSLLIIAGSLFKKHNEKLSCMSLFWFTVFVSTGAGLCQIYEISSQTTLSGGIVGKWFSESLQKVIGYGGTLIVLWALLWVSFVMMSGISLAKIFFPKLQIFTSFVFFYIVFFIKFFLVRILNICEFLWKCIKTITVKVHAKPTIQAAQMENGNNHNQQKKDFLFVEKQEENFFCDEEKITKNVVDDSGQEMLSRYAKECLEKSPFIAKRFANKKIVSVYEDKKRKEKKENKECKWVKRKFIVNTVFKKNIFSTPKGANRSPFESVMEEVATRLCGEGNVMKNTYKLPGMDLFISGNNTNCATPVNTEAIIRGKKLEQKLQHFGVRGKITAIHPGPIITMYEYQPEIDSKLSKIVSLEDDLAMALSALSIRIIAPIPGKNAVGFEIANQARQGVLFSRAVASKGFQEFFGQLPLALGVNVIGNPIVHDLSAMPHLLIGGTTGSGKSVGLNTMIASLLCKQSPKDLRMILIDPKRLEFTPYANIPHLLFPIVSNPIRATSILKWVVQEMEERYERMALVGVRNFLEYRKAVQAKQKDQDKQQLQDIPYLVVVIDELADLMIVAGKDIETHIVRIAQMARAAGIHMIVATQRPSVDVVTGLIKVNFPSRIAFRVSSKVDSRTILDQQGAEKLLGRGDMLFMDSTTPNPIRVHGPYVSDYEIQKLTNHLRTQASPEYLNLNEVLDISSHDKRNELEDTLYPEVLSFLKDMDEVSISLLQRKLSIGFNRSARIIERLEQDGILAPAQGSKPRRVLKH